MRFIVANYGTRHLGMLLAHLESVARSHPGAAQSVYWQDIPDRFVSAMQSAFPQVEWVRTEFDFARDPIQRISSKVLCWGRGAEEHAGESALAFCDSDTLVRRDITSFFRPDDADVIFTSKPENVPLNTGVLLACGGAPAMAFFRAWREATLSILRSPQEYAKANESSLPYGGTDQMSLFQLLGYARAQVNYTLTLPAADLGSAPSITVRLRAEPCAQLNETNSRPLADDIHIVHYKAGWQSILLDGRPFSRFRPRQASWGMLSLFLETLSAGLARVNQATGEHFTARDFHVQRLWYYRSGKFNSWAYAAWRVRAACQRAWLAVTGRLQPGM